MKIGAFRSLRRPLSVIAIGVLIPLIAACTGRGGGQLPPDTGFSDSASFGFTFSCQDSGGINPPTGQLKIELSYNDKGTSVIGSSFGIHGIVDEIDPLLVSQYCIGKNPPPFPENQLIFLGRYYLTSSAPAGFLPKCANQANSTAPLCRFEVIVQDNDKSSTPSDGDYFSIKLSGSTDLDCGTPTQCTQLNPPEPAPQYPPPFYSRGGTLSAGNLTVS